MNEVLPADRHALPIAGGPETAREIWRLSRGRRLSLGVVASVGLLSTVADLVPPLAIGILVDRVQEGTADLRTVLAVSAIMVISAVLGAAGTAVTIVLAARTYHAILATLRERLVERALRIPQHLVERAGTGDLISRSSDDVTAVADAAPAVIPTLTVTVLGIIVSLAGLAFVELPYAAAFVVVLPVYALALRWYLRTGPRVYRAERTAMSGRAQQILESHRGYATVLGFGLGEQRHHALLTSSWGVALQVMRARAVQSMLNARLNAGECLSLAAVLVIGFVLIDRGASTVGAATTAMLLVLRLLGPVNQLMFVIDTLQSALASLNRLVGVATIPDAVQHRDESAGSEALVQARGVMFHYDDGPRVLDDVTLDITSGEHVAVVGASGAGKTTLAAVIAGILPPRAGTVSHPERTAVISQEVHVFATTVRENLTLAAPRADDDAIRAALRATGADALIHLLPDGLDTLVGQGGHTLTDAQAQQLALARLLLADPSLAILDEATAEAGSAHAGMLDRGAEAALRGRAGLVIAHRLSQAASCDRIVVMERGRIIEQGSHADLLASDGIYSRLWKAWRTGQDIGEADDGRLPE